MDKKVIQILVFLLCCQKSASQAQISREGARVEIQCTLSTRASQVIWFRLSGNSGVQYIASFHNGNLRNLSSAFGSIFAAHENSQNTMVLKSFSQSRDSGTYSCGSVHKSTLHFGEVRRLAGEEPLEMTTQEPPPTTTPMLSTSPVTCAPKIKHEKVGSPVLCNSILLASLGGGCGLLLLLLIVTVCYCNRIRTRGCPHHYRRKRPANAPQKREMDGRYA
ncbi:T-cell surface glycoprotein CD8 alpha chain [Lampris incognitus]|uniref:T-cell surface glycoprotein CD8 alpha chain n=1 Tax=Lampris incognitus TaxID=2546036 RepID=UPI0024B481AE|nr:T-cell surface glycoprotein CD8 alpha chain [Lampris incognitus]